jgi:NTE family protein
VSPIGMANRDGTWPTVHDRVGAVAAPTANRIRSGCVGVNRYPRRLLGTVTESAVRSVVPILAGGGTRLPAHVGVLRGLEELGLSFADLVGVSGGAIVAALRAAGHSHDELHDLALEVDFSQFLGHSLWRLVREGGFSSGDRFERWMDDQIGGVTFADLPLNLHVVATDVCSGSPVVFDRYRTPTLRVARAVRFSMGIPLLFTFKPYGDHLLVDGSILAEDALRQDWSGDGAPVVCFRLRSSGQRRRYRSQRWFPLVHHLSLLLRTFLNTLSREYVTDAHWHRTVVVETGDLSPVEFKMTRAEKQRLYDAGYHATLDHLPWKLERALPRPW